jgi:hypothetical protein
MYEKDGLEHLGKVEIFGGEEVCVRLCVRACVCVCVYYMYTSYDSILIL